MVVLGGMGSMLGSVISAVVLTILPEMLRSFSDYRMVVYSLALVLMMIFRPKGLMGTYDFSMGASIEAAAARIRGLFGRKKGDGPEVDGPAGDVPAPEGADNASDKEAGR